MSSKPLILGAVLAALCAACGAPQKLTIKNPFPSKKELTKIAANKVATEAVEPPDVGIVETWTLHGPFPDTIGYREYAPQNEVEKAFYGALPADKRLAHSQAMNCAAREIARFGMEQDKIPNASLRRFIFARCGAQSAGNTVSYHYVKNGTEKDIAGQAKRAVKSVEKMLAKTNHHLDVGMWFGKVDNTVVVGFTEGEKLVDLQPTPMRPGADGQFVLQGRLLLPHMERVGALINQGDYGYANCKSDPSVSLPAFKITCPTVARDAMAYFQVMAATKGSIMAHTVLNQMVWPAGQLADVYRSPATRRALARAKAHQASTQGSLTASNQVGTNADADAAAGSPTTAGDQSTSDEQKTDASTPKSEPEPKPLADSKGAVDAKEYPARFIALLNEVRKEAGIDPLDHAARQSVAIQSVAEQFLAASEGDDVALTNKLSLGILAGWDVDGPVIDAEVSSNWAGSHDPAELLETMLETPGGRRTLMDPSSSQVAVGAVERDDAISGIVASYAFVPHEHPNRRARRVLDRLSEQRRAYGSNAAREVPELRADARNMSRLVEQGKLGVVEARNRLMDETSRHFHKAVRGYAFVAHSLDDIDFPKAMLQSKNLPVAVVVAPFTKKGFPWTMYAVVVVFPVQPRAHVAMLD